MNVTLVSLQPPPSATDAGRPALTPELLAATGARYSRNNEGLSAILEQIDPQNPDASVDRIFRFVDYGHQSIADMAPVALFMDGISLFLAYYLWTLCPTAGGQESSTRYIRLSRDGLVDPETLGIPDERGTEWANSMEEAFSAYKQATQFWEQIGKEQPERARIPRSLLDDPSDRAKKTVQRMRRNFAFDRARYFLPVAATTNVMLIQSARAWVTLCQHLLSHPLPEVRQLGETVRNELALATPRLLRHAVRQTSLEQGLDREFNARRQKATEQATINGECAAEATLEVFLPPETVPETLTADLGFHENRYAYFGETLRRTAVRFAWNAVAFAEIRDLNRHRTGTKYCPLVPVGFYMAEDELPEPAEIYTNLRPVGEAANTAALQLLQQGDPTYIYHTLLGTQYSFEHTTTADKFLYEAELRTGAGAHYRYADHLRQMLARWYERFPETKGLVLEGSAEPE